MIIVREINTFNFVWSIKNMVTQVIALNLLIRIPSRIVALNNCV